ncbi:MAG: response regulator [Candidatus Hatepunaea meridiana]|nr:response regulator [Candidatus Hatepunaea meridiana]
MKKKSHLCLIIDDEPDMCWALENLLLKNGLQAKSALNAEEALSLLNQNRFKLILLDAKLPDMDGLDLADKIRKIDPSVRIVMISGYFYQTDEDVQKAISKKLIHGFISKPFIHDQVIQQIKQL